MGLAAAFGILQLTPDAGALTTTAAIPSDCEYSTVSRTSFLPARKKIHELSLCLG